MFEGRQDVNDHLQIYMTLSRDINCQAASFVLSLLYQREAIRIIKLFTKKKI